MSRPVHPITQDHIAWWSKIWPCRLCWVLFKDGTHVQQCHCWCWSWEWEKPLACR